MNPGVLSNPITDAQLADLLDTHAPWGRLASIPDMWAWQADSELSLWQALEAACGVVVDAPFFCVAWPGAQALAWALREGLVQVRGRRVVDVGCGSGVAGVAAARAGARQVLVADIDAHAVRSACILGVRHGVEVAPLVTDVLAQPELVQDGDVAVCADLIYNSEQATRFASVLAQWRARGVEVLVADSGRPFFDAQRFGLDEVGALEVRVAASVDGRHVRTARVFVHGQA